ncbi:MAG: hypothetical protein ACJ760_07075 [Thermoleophilaceae bacterium]
MAWIAGAAAVAAVGAGIGTAGASTKLDSFSGSCAFRGNALFSPPATDQQQRLDVHYAGPGTCTGSLDGRPVSNAKVHFYAHLQSDGSCNRAKTVRPGSARIVFADGTTIRASEEFDFVGTEGTLTWRGRRSGRASGHGSFVTDRTPPDVAARCASGGVRKVPLDIDMTTGPPLVSKRQATRRLQVTVAPRAAVAGRRTRFAFRVTRGGGVPVDGTTVALAGKHAHTGPRGHASVVAALPRRGTWHATATKAGFRAGRADVEARPARPLRLDGNCDFAGTVAFDPPLTNTARPTAQRVRGRGTCSGTLVDAAGIEHELDSAAARYVAGAAAQPQSCSEGTSTGSGALVLRWGRLQFTTAEKRAGAAPLLTATGRSGGSAVVNGRATDDPTTLLSKCAADGIAVAHLSGQLSTTPDISG